MNLLICTQKVDRNDDVLGFFHGWIAEFAKHCDRVFVITNFEGEHRLPDNVSVISLGKERGVGKFGRLINFYKSVYLLLRHHKAVLVHMTPIHLLLAGLIWRAGGKKIALWYTHKSVDAKLRLGALFAHHIFTASNRSLRLKTKKKRVVGHGIDLEYFKPMAPNSQNSNYIVNYIVPEKDKNLNIVTIGRISAMKDYVTLIRAVDVLRERGLGVSLTIVGNPITDADEMYLTNIERMVEKRGLESFVSFTGSIPNREILPYLQSSDVFVNLSSTGSIDKAVLEAVAAGLMILTSNEAFAEFLGPYKEALMFKAGDYDDLADKLSGVNSPDLAKAREYLRNEVEQKHNLKKLIPKILETMS